MYAIGKLQLLSNVQQSTTSINDIISKINQFYALPMDAEDKQNQTSNPDTHSKQWGTVEWHKQKILINYDQIHVDHVIKDEIKSHGIFFGVMPSLKTVFVLTHLNTSSMNLIILPQRLKDCKDACYELYSFFQRMNKEYSSDIHMIPIEINSHHLFRILDDYTSDLLFYGQRLNINTMLKKYKIDVLSFLTLAAGTCLSMIISSYHPGTIYSIDPQSMSNNLLAASIGVIIPIIIKLLCYMRTSMFWIQSE